MSGWIFSAVAAVGGDNVVIAILGAIINVIVMAFLAKRYRSKSIATIVTFLAAAVASVLSFHFLAAPATHQSWGIVAVFLTSMLLWTVFFHVLAINFAHAIAGIDLGRFSVLSRNWVKAIDYVYLVISALSILKIVVSLAVTSPGLAYFNAIATVFLGLAVALRLTRTSIEIFGWDKARTS